MSSLGRQEDSESEGTITALSGRLLIAADAKFVTNAVDHCPVLPAAAAVQATASAAVLVISWHLTTRPFRTVHKCTRGESIRLPVFLTRA